MASNGAPFDRIISAYAVTQLPSAWLRQLRPGGLVLTPMHDEFDAGGVAVWTAHDQHHAIGQFLPLIHQAQPLPSTAHTARWTDLLVQARRTRTAGQPCDHDVSASVLADNAFRLFAALRLPHVAVRTVGETGTDRTETWLLSTDGSWALEVRSDSHLSWRQHGHRQLWQELADAHRTWVWSGRPTRTQLGVTHSPTGQHTWINEPDAQPPLTHPDHDQQQ